MDLFNQITSQTTLLTPNRRLAAVVSKAYSEWQLKQNKKVWPTLDILPLYPSWLERLWQTYASQEMRENSILLTTHQENLIWEKLLRNAPENEILLQISETAKLAKSAWEILKRWQIHLSDPNLQLTEDSRIFFNWAKTFQTFCLRNQLIDQNSLADIVYEKMESLKIPSHIVLLGFTEIAPQYQQLLTKCEHMGTKVEHYQFPSRNHSVVHIGIRDTETEIRTMARWAKNLSHQAKSIGCVIPNLESVREQVSQIFSEVFSDTDSEGEVNISAGKSLISYPIIHDALSLLKLNCESISINTFSKILHSPFVGEAEQERYQRSLFELRLQYSNIHSLDLQQLIDKEMKPQLKTTCPALANRIENFLKIVNSFPPNKLLPLNQWVTCFNELLIQFGWPGERSLNSEEFQVVHNCWLPLLGEYATFDHILEPLNYQDALHYLISLASHTMFQPESPEASIHVLGLLEAAEIPFEHTWIMGLDDTTWPARPKPNPFIPIRMQKMWNMPNASAERELTYCQELTHQLVNSAEQVILSYPQQRDDNELRPSSLIAGYNEIKLESLTLSPFVSFAEKIFASRLIESLQDYSAPAITDEEVLGGVKIFQNQAACPFKAFAEHRLHARKIEETTIGLRKLDRGNIIHQSLELIWKELGNSVTLQMKSEEELRAIIHCNAEKTLYQIATPNQNNQRYLKLELQRLEKIIWDWLQIEKSRPPFQVIALEQEITARIGQLTAQFRVDRIDELINETTLEKHLIIDYKTGKEINKNDWFGHRPDEPQLPIYCIANPDKTIGIAFAKINPNKMGMVGISKSPLKINSINPLADLKQADATLWDEQMKIWQTHLTELANHFYTGKADVDPKDINQTCRLCGLQSLCRIHELTYYDNEYENENSNN